jgi:protein-S-isoprenylcysteine O-methyltransferase Ste14
LFWLANAFRAKRSIHNNKARLGVGFRIVIVIVFLVLMHVPALYRTVLNIYVKSFYTNIFIGSIGFFIFCLGFTLLIWARVRLGKNWGEPMTVKEKPQLVTTGPYALIRHPIYAGFIIAMLGTTLVINLIWLIPFILLSAYFVYSLNVEEKDLIKQFPNEYKEYKKRTKALFPFIY